jgi:two-component system sensor histidine kinase PilS (NtrC family)
MIQPAVIPQPTDSGPPSGQNLLLFRIYLIYRTVLSVVFLLLQMLPATRELVGAENPALYTTVTAVFLATNLLLLGAVAARWQRSNARLVLLFGVDIACITLLGDASGGMVSGLPLLLTVTVAASAVLISNRTVATLVAALAVLALLSDTLRLVSTTPLPINALFPAGLLGVLFFVVSAIVQIVALRLSKVEALASARASDIYRLQRLNEQIVQQLQTGILLVDAAGRARLMNAAAGRLLDLNRPVALEQGRYLAEYGESLAASFDAYRERGEQPVKTLRTRSDGMELLVRFLSLEGGDEPQVLVFLDDYRPFVAHAQSLKLSSLGRLAASIAHEIRNPLGAISHATQLLQESPDIAAQDRRMLDMVMTNSARVNDIVESVLQVSRREPPNSSVLPVAEWLSGYRQRYLDVRKDAGEVTIEYADPDARIRFDPEHLQRVLDNLVDNAMRHSLEARGEAHAELRVRVDKQRGQCMIDVYDDGPGVDGQDVARLFEPFFTRSHGGSGLGLYLCRELCELNQARIAYAPTSDGRSRFQVTLAQQDQG